MSNPYDDALVAPADDARTLLIRGLNDAFRTEPRFIGAMLARNQLVVTRGIAERGNDFVNAAVCAVRSFDAFNASNDPHGEHDFGEVSVDGQRVWFKIDYFDEALKYGSADPSDSTQTRRVLTILLPSEY